MKILFVWDIAGVCSTFAKYIRRKGYECTVISRTTQDVFHFLHFYGEQSLYVDGKEFDDIALKMAADYDIIHCSAWQIALLIKEKYPNKPVIMEYHGSDLRLGEIEDARMVSKKLDKILVSTPDLLEYLPDAQWIPNPVDTDHFKPSNHKQGILFLKPPYQSIPELPFNFKVIHRNDTITLFKNMPKLFEEFNIYIDWKYDTNVKKLIIMRSKTALEALATGMTVYTVGGILVQGLPDEHRPENVIPILEKVYRELCP